MGCPCADCFSWCDLLPARSLSPRRPAFIRRKRGSYKLDLNGRNYNCSLLLQMFHCLWLAVTWISSCSSIVDHCTQSCYCAIHSICTRGWQRADIPIPNPETLQRVQSTQDLGTCSLCSPFLHWQYLSLRGNWKGQNKCGFNLENQCRSGIALQSEI